MTGSDVVKYLNPWKLNREKQRQRVEVLRQRDGENCRRCRHPMRFDLPHGHDQSAIVVQIFRAIDGEVLDNLCLTHMRCNSAGADHTDEVTERIRRRNEAALLSRSRSAKKARATG